MNAEWKTFEHLEVYNIAREFRRRIFKLIKLLPKEEKMNLSVQMRRAATSLTNNLAEGHGRFHYLETIHFCVQSRGSLQELIDDINICLDEKYFQQKHLEELKEQAYNVLKKLNGYIAYLKRQKTK
ncbi:MAG: four helix bundle protein, partial [bacterium]|nr:four helix bundle protein [bacterium]